MTLDDFQVISSEGPLCSQHDSERRLVVEAPDGRRFRVDIRVNFYAFQSSATVEVWRDGQWVNVVRKLPETVSAAVRFVTSANSPIWPQVCEEFSAFEMAILDEAMAVSA